MKAIIFDLDGTLVNTPDLIMDSFKVAIHTHLADYELSEEEITDVLGQTLTSAFKNYAKDEKHLEDMIETFRNTSNNMDHKPKGFEYLENVIQYLVDKDYKVGIVTSKTDFVVHQNLKDLNIDHLFDCVITHEDTEIHKPNPEPILLAMEKLGVTPEESIYIGDHENDIIAGRNAKTKTGLMSYSYRYNQAMDEKPDYVFDSLKDLKKVF